MSRSPSRSGSRSGPVAGRSASCSNPKPRSPPTTMWRREPCARRCGCSSARAPWAAGEARKVVLRKPRPAAVAEEFRSFAQWASAHGRTPGGQVIEQTWRIAGAENAAALRVDHRDRVLQVLRVRLLDGEKVMVERTSYPESLGEIVERIPADT